MDFFAAISSSLISIVFFCMIVAGVLKLFQIGTLLTEIKDLLQNQRHQNNVPPVAAAYEKPETPAASARWTPAPPAATRAPAAPRAPATADYPSYSAMNRSATAVETVPQVIREQLTHEPQPASAQAYVASAVAPVHPQEALPLPLDAKMSGEEMLRALDLELRAEEARRAPAVVDTTIVSPGE